MNGAVLAWVRGANGSSLAFRFFFLMLVLIKQWVVLSEISQVGSGRFLALSILSSALLVVPWFCFLGFYLQGTAFLLFDIGYTLLLYGDLLFFRQFRDLPSFEEIGQLGELWNVRDSLGLLFASSDFLLFASIPIVMLVMFSKRYRELCFRKSSPASIFSAFFFALLMTLFCSAMEKSSVKGYLGDTWRATRLGLFNFHLVDAVHFTGRRLRSKWASRESLAEVQRWFSNRLATASPKGLSQKERGLKNVLVIQFESLQTFALGLRIGGKEITPELNRLAKSSLFFTDFYSQAGKGGTADADFVTNCSNYPLQTGAVFVEYANNRFDCLPGILQRAGFFTAAVHPLRADFYNLAKAHQSLGFQRFFSKADFVDDERIGYGLSDRSMFRQSLDKIAASKKPWFYFLITTTSHTPFRYPELKQELPLGEFKDTRLGDYVEAIHYTDKALGEFFRGLEEKGLLEETILVVYGDHTGIHRGNSNLSALFPIPLDDEVKWHAMEKKVPLLIRIPGGKNSKEDSTPAGQIDIAPTLLRLLGMELAGHMFFGRDLLSEPKGVVSAYDGSVLDDLKIYLSGEARPFKKQCLDRLSGKEIPLGACSHLIEEGQRAMRISRLITEGDLGGQFLKGFHVKSP